MAGSRIDMPVNGASDWSDFVTQVVRQRLGFMSMSLTNFETTGEALIASGSVLDVNGTVYQFTSNESVTGWSNIATAENVYIKVVPSGDSITASYTGTGPTFDQAKGGWYDSNDRYIGWLRKDSSGDYRYKHTLPVEQIDPILFTEVIDIGDWNMDSTPSATLTHHLDVSNIKGIEVSILTDNGDWHNFLGDYAGAACGYYSISTASIFLNRENAGHFDSVLFDSTSYNRGHVRLTHEI
jgi:hypothetical protein